MSRHGSRWLRVLLAVVVASLLTIAHEPPVHAQDDPGASTCRRPLRFGQLVERLLRFERGQR